MQKSHKFFLMFVVMLIWAAPLAAKATRITNLSGEVQEITLQVQGNEFKVQLKPGNSWRTRSYPLQLKKKSGSQLLELDADYAIWPDGTFSLQRRYGGVQGSW